MSDTFGVETKYSNLISEIQKVVSEAWTQYRVAVVLAKVGTRLSSEAKEELRLSGGKLKSFVRLHMRDQLRSLYSPDLTDVVAPLPESNEMSDQIILSNLRAHLRGNIRDRPMPLLRFKSEVWRGFTSPMTAAERYLELRSDGDVSLINGPKGASDAAKYVPIELRHLAFDGVGGRLKIHEAVQRIKDWAKEFGVDLRILYDEEFSAQILREREESRHVQGELGSINLNDVISILNNEELSRIAIPADILVKILKASR